MIAPIIPPIPLLPVAFKSMVAMSRVAIDIPETGLLDEPISPTIREETVAKKKPKIMTISAPRKFSGIAGTSHITRATITVQISRNFMERSCSVRSVPFVLCP